LTLLIAIYFLSKGQGEISGAKASESSAIQLTAKSNLLLALALDHFTEAAKTAAELAAAQNERNLRALENQKASINHVDSSINEHIVSSDARAVATLVRDEATSAAIAALPGKIQLVMQEASDELMLQIQVDLKAFMARLKVDRASKPTGDIKVEVVNPDETLSHPSEIEPDADVVPEENEEQDA